jgi:hypothetical protein
MWYISYIVRTFVNATVYSHPAQLKKTEIVRRENANDYQ